MTTQETKKNVILTKNRFTLTHNHKKQNILGNQMNPTQVKGKCVTKKQNCFSFKVCNVYIEM